MCSFVLAPFDKDLIQFLLVSGIRPLKTKIFNKFYIIRLSYTQILLAISVKNKGGLGRNRYDMIYSAHHKFSL